MPYDFTDDDRAEMIELLREIVAADPRFPLWPRIRRLQAILVKRVPRPPVETLPAPKPPGERSMALTKKRRR